MARTRAQTAAQKAAPSPNNQGTRPLQRKSTLFAYTCRKLTAGHPAAQRQFSEARNRARRTQSSAPNYAVSASMPSILRATWFRSQLCIDRTRRRLSRAEVASASNQSNTHSTPTQTRSDGNPLHVPPKTQLASRRLAATPTNPLTRLLPGRRKGAGQRSGTGPKRPQRRILPWTVVSLRGRNPRPLCPRSD